jgi:sugar phosphate isomerase/epimerase
VAPAPRLAVQLYSVRDHLEDLDRTLEQIARLGIDAVEPFNVLDDRLGRALERQGIEAPSAQFPFLSDDVEVDGERFELPSPESVFDAAAALGVGLLLDPIVEAARWRTTAEVDRTADRLNAAAEVAAAHGLRVGYHNHSFEFHARFDGTSAYERFASRLDERVSLELDVFWVAVAGEDAVQLVRRLGPRLRALHVKDGAIPADPFAPGATYEPGALDQRPAGEGDVPLAAILAAAPAVELDVIEFDHVTGDPWPAIARSAAWIRAIRSG